jgi:hypothetical protein
MKHSMLTLILVIMTSCVHPGGLIKQSWILQNELNEEVKLEGFHIPFNYPIQPLEKGEYALEANESLKLFESSIEPGDFIQPTTSLRLFLGIQSVDSLIITFENGKKLTYRLIGDLDPLNPLNAGHSSSSWITMEIEKDKFETKFYISPIHKSSAQ